jgi:hypothetical protein
MLMVRGLALLLIGRWVLLDPVPGKVRVCQRADPAQATMLLLRELESAYVRFVADHEADCPRSLKALLPYMNKKTTVDRWGSRIDFTCPFEVVSPGPDRVLGTADDVSSRGSTIRSCADHPCDTSSQRTARWSPVGSRSGSGNWNRSASGRGSFIEAPKRSWRPLQGPQRWASRRRGAMARFGPPIARNRSRSRVATGARGQIPSRPSGRKFALVGCGTRRTADEMLRRLQHETPGQFADGQLRTLQRRVKEWRREAVRNLIFSEPEVKLRCEKPAEDYHAAATLRVASLVRQHGGERN